MMHSDPTEFDPSIPPPPPPHTYNPYALSSYPTPYRKNYNTLLIILACFLCAAIILCWGVFTVINLHKTGAVSISTPTPSQAQYTAQDIAGDVQQAGGNVTGLADNETIWNYSDQSINVPVQFLSSVRWYDIKACNACEPPNYWLGVYASVKDAASAYNDMYKALIEDQWKGLLGQPIPFHSGRCLLLDGGSNPLIKQVVEQNCL